MRVSSDKQTLILAGEATPPPRADVGRSAGDSSGTGSPLRRLAMLLVQVDAPAVPPQGVVPHLSSGRALSAGAAEYARTQNLSAGSARIQLIDTYA